ncbi:hypothetical protein [Lichenicoccus sp.]
MTDHRLVGAGAKADTQQGTGLRLDEIGFNERACAAPAVAPFP